MTLYQVKALRRVKARDGSITQRRETRRFDCDTLDEARAYFANPDLTLIGEVEEAKL